MISYFDEQFSISLLMPEAWQVTSSETFPFLIFAPKVDDYHTNLGFRRVEGLETLNAASFQQIIDNTQYDFRSDYARFVLLGEQKQQIDGCPAYVSQYEWQDEPSQRHFSQLVALIAVDPNTLVEIHGATLKHLEGEYIPLLVEIVESIRFIPRRTPSA